MTKLKYAVSTFFAPSGGRCSRHHTMNPRRELLGLLITSHSCTWWQKARPWEIHNGRYFLRSAGITPLTLISRSSLWVQSRVVGHHFFFWNKPRFRTFLWFYLFYLLKNLVRWGPMARFATLLLIWLASLRNLAAWDAMADGELGGILVWRMVRMSRLAKFYDKASVIKHWQFHGNMAIQAIHGIWFETNRSVNIVNISTRFGHPLLSSFSLNCEFLRTLSARWSQRRGKTLYRIGSTIHEENIKLRVVLGKLFVNAFASTWFSMFRLLTFTKVSTLKTT